MNISDGGRYVYWFRFDYLAVTAEMLFCLSFARVLDSEKVKTAAAAEDCETAPPPVPVPTPAAAALWRTRSHMRYVM